MSIGSDSQSSSQHLSSSISSLNQSKRTSSEISKIYKHASQLFLTRRLLEAFEALQPIITPPETIRPEDSPAQAPIATASTSQRIKIWSLYVTLLNSIVGLGFEEGRAVFGQDKYRHLVRQVQSGSIWEQVVKDGYQGREDSVDAEVVYNLYVVSFCRCFHVLTSTHRSTLLLGQAPDQKLNQARLEIYLSSSHPDIDLSTQLNSALSNGRQPGMNGTNTPKDLSSRIKILELFTLHVLPRNEEWDYAKSFIANSDILDEERREAFAQTLQELQDVSEGKENFQPAEEVIDETESESPVVSPRVKDEGTARRQSQQQNTIKHQRTSSEVDYGIEEERPSSIHGSLPSEATPTTAPKETSRLTKLPPKPEPTAPPAVPRSPPAPSNSIGRTHLSPPAQTPRRPARKQPKAAGQNALFAQARQLFVALSNLARNMAGTLSKNPTSVLRFILFLLAFIMAFSQKQIRDRTRRIVGQSWDKVRATIGMGTKVSYI